MPAGSNYTFIAVMSATGHGQFLSIYKPQRGESPSGTSRTAPCTGESTLLRGQPPPRMAKHPGHDHPGWAIWGRHGADVCSNRERWDFETSNESIARS